jgi:manganese transport protein
MTAATQPQSLPGFLRRLAAFVGPGFLVSVGYMDPGNWATDLVAGAKYGYALLWVVLASSLMAMLLQALAAKLAIATGRDLAQACRDRLPHAASFFLWLLAEGAIIATDLAEVLGTAIGLNLLFGLPILWGVVITSLDVFVILALQRWGFRKVEIFVLTLLAVIFASFVGQMLLSQPSLAGIAGGLVPHPALLSDTAALYIALGIIGATVMPHNLYLHSGLVRERLKPDRAESLRLALWDSNIALSFAFFINAALLILAAATFATSGHSDVAELNEAHRLLSPLLGSLLAPKLFAIALVACGLNSALTATLAGQIVMEGFINIRMPAWARRLVTRLAAIVPAMGFIWAWGDAGSSSLLVASQVVLAFQLPFAMVPLVAFTSSRKMMGPWTNGAVLAIGSALLCALLIGLNVFLVKQSLGL